MCRGADLFVCLPLKSFLIIQGEGGPHKPGGGMHFEEQKIRGLARAGVKTAAGGMDWGLRGLCRA